MNPDVDKAILNTKKWRDEIRLLQRIVLACHLTEELKWSKPCYSFDKNNVAIIGGFKAYCALSFFKGVLLKDAHDLLVAPGPNSQTVRIMKFINVEEISKRESVIKSYLLEAIALEKLGKKVVLKDSSDLILPDELLNVFKERKDIDIAFRALTPGRQRGYVLFFTAPKQSKTVVSRIEKNISRILDGKGIHDCVCGLTKRMPKCDGSHKVLEK